MLVTQPNIEVDENFKVYSLEFDAQEHILELLCNFHIELFMPSLKKFANHHKFQTVLAPSVDIHSFSWLL
jgi:hypothetical protein